MCLYYCRSRLYSTSSDVVVIKMRRAGESNEGQATFQTPEAPMNQTSDPQSQI